jgi:hypothetical protein
MTIIIVLMSVVFVDRVNFNSLRRVCHINYFFVFVFILNFFNMLLLLSHYHLNKFQHLPYRLTIPTHPSGFWDVRKNGAVETSPIEFSHHDPVYDVQWIQSRTNQEFCSVSTDGFIMWWDIRKLNGTHFGLFQSQYIPTFH